MKKKRESVGEERDERERDERKRERRKFGRFHCLKRRL